MTLNQTHLQPRSEVARELRAGGWQADGSEALNDRHTLRAGFSLVTEQVSSDATTTVFPLDPAGDPNGPAFAIASRDRLRGNFYGGYVQDEWKLTPRLTLNYGTRFDVFHSRVDRESQLSPRAGLIYQASANTTLHAGYARYFTPPPVENVGGEDVAQFDHTSNAAPSHQADPVRAERSHYFDAGASHTLASGLQLGIDAYYKRATNQLDDGLFGATRILSAFNYARGKTYGVELTASYTRGGLSTYANLARSTAKGRAWSSSQFLFDPADLAYVRDHWIFLDHDQSLSASTGVSYRWKRGRRSTLLFTDVIYGSGLRNDATAPDGSSIPNGASVPAYATLNLGVERSWKVSPHGEWKLRLDVVNVADHSYQLRDGSGVGVNAAQYGARRGFFGSVGYKF